LIANKDQVWGWYSNTERQIIKSSKYPNGNSARWYRRTTNLEDPWISLDHHVSRSPNMYLYGENNHSGYSFDFVKNNGGAKVYIRLAPKDSIDQPDQPECLKPPTSMQEDCQWRSRCVRQHHFDDTAGKDAQGSIAELCEEKETAQGC
jgi:hypothetical protein